MMTVIKCLIYVISSLCVDLTVDQFIWMLLTCNLIGAQVLNIANYYVRIY